MKSVLKIESRTAIFEMLYQGINTLAELCSNYERAFFEDANDMAYFINIMADEYSLNIDNGIVSIAETCRPITLNDFKLSSSAFINVKLSNISIVVDNPEILKASKHTSLILSSIRNLQYELSRVNTLLTELNGINLTCIN